MQQTDGPAMQRVGPLAAALDVLRERGVDPQDAFTGLPIVLDDVNPDAMIPFGAALQLLANCEGITGLDHFGLIAGARRDHLSLGPIGQLMHHAPTLGDALRDYIRVQVGMSRGATVYSYPIDDCVTLGFGIYERHHAGAKAAYGLTMALGANLVRALSGGKANPIEIHFCHRPPKDPGVYERILKTKVLFDQYQSCLILPRSCLQMANPDADMARYQSMSTELAAMLRMGAVDPVVMLRHRMKPLFLQGEFSLAAVARKLEIHPRTLNRRLLDQGTSFAEIRDEARIHLAQELLALTDLPIGEVAAALSYSSHANFVRAFRRLAGLTPSMWRSQVEAHVFPDASAK